MTSFSTGRFGGHSAAYRPDIDGLRAVAVSGVVLFHAVPVLTPGGFLGVDVFFVISGFLITGMLIRECESGTFSLIRFYERRIRRILPALAAMLLVVSGLAYAVLTPSDLTEYGRSLASVALLSSNRFFLSRTGYFDLDSHDNLLLHTWSLSIEEQFYLIWPLAVLVLWGSRLKRFAPP